tara:strand:+ start:110 stop:412 length:303 start_codon:yes stop_codon:yes gene_type:complete
MPLLVITQGHGLTTLTGLSLLTNNYSTLTGGFNCCVIYTVFILSNNPYWYQSSGCIQLIDDTYYGDDSSCDPYDSTYWEPYPIQCGPIDPPLPLFGTWDS